MSGSQIVSYIWSYEHSNWLQTPQWIMGQAALTATFEVFKWVRGSRTVSIFKVFFRRKFHEMLHHCFSEVAIFSLQIPFPLPRNVEERGYSNSSRYFLLHWRFRLEIIPQAVQCTKLSRWTKVNGWHTHAVVSNSIYSCVRKYCLRQIIDLSVQLKWQDQKSPVSPKKNKKLVD